MLPLCADDYADVAFYDADAVFSPLRRFRRYAA